MYVSNSLFNVLINLYNVGIIQKHQEIEQMFVNSLGNEFKIILERKDRHLFSADSSTSYLCLMKFCNIFGTEVLKLTGSEVDMNR